MSVPQIPPRPVRSQQQQQHPTVAPSDIPKIPPRPDQRQSSERSQSPNRDHFPRSPLNEAPLGMSLGMTLSNKSGSIHGSSSQNASSSNLDLPQRPPSVSLPSIGQEGNEYADINYKPDAPNEATDTAGGEPYETRNVGSDLPLHAPKPSFSNSTAKRRVSAVTRTDSTQAAAAGYGKAPTPSDDKNPHDRVLKPKVSFRTVSSASTERPGSSQTEDDHGIPEIGQRVPMYPDAGDVQAPSPSPLQQAFPAGIGYHNAGMQKASRHHRRTPSGREILPPGSYGMHGHGVAAADPFEKSWYEKHPDALEMEEPAYGPGIGGGRGEWALSSDDLNKLVRETSSEDSLEIAEMQIIHLANMTSLESDPNTPGLPKEELGYSYMAAEEKMNTPSYKPMHSNHSQPHVESPLRKASFPVDAETDYAFEKKQSHTSSRFSSDNALESETEDDEGPLAPATTRKDTIYRNGYDGAKEYEGFLTEERGYGVPILASDEVARTPYNEYLQPAVSPAQSRRGSAYYTGPDNDAFHPSGTKIGSRSGSASNSRPPSRPGSVHSLQGLSRFSTHDDDHESMHTPLEDVDEYEPLFPDEDGNKERRPVTAADRLKLREQMKRFPSKDIWEDTPNSLQLQATVETPEPANEQPDPTLKAPAAVFETPEQESARKGEVSEDDKVRLIPREERLAKSHFKPHLRDERRRPGLAQRFPSRDIWEDPPDSARLETTVGDVPNQDPRSLTDEGLEAGAVVSTSGAPNQGIIAGDQPRDNATVGAAVAKPTIPARLNKDESPASATDLGIQSPPSVPARPPRRLHQVPPADAQVPTAPSKLSQTSPTDAKQLSPTEARKAPVLPERKSQLPTRPAKPVSRESSETVSLRKIASASSDGGSDQGRDLVSPPLAPKPKPAVPARPAGGKIASLKAGFLSDLDSRLKLGPQGPKPQEKAGPEIEEDKAPLADARKGRAKGPTRRKPVAPSATETAIPGAGEESKAMARNWGIQEPWTVWQHDGALRVGHETHSMPKSEPITLGDISKAAQAPASTSQADGAEDAKDIQQAKQAVEEEPLAAMEPVSHEKVAAPETAEAWDPTAKEAGKETESLSSSPSTVVSPITTSTQSQTGEKTMTVNPDTEEEEKTTAIVGGEAQGGDAIVRED